MCSLVAILFSQISKLCTTAAVTGFSSFDLTVVPIMVLAAIAGGFIGAALNKKISEKTVEKAFNCVQILVFMITVFNIVKNVI